MALITCSECGTEISDTASACVKCGAPMHVARARSVEASIEDGREAFSAESLQSKAHLAKSPKTRGSGFKWGVGIVVGLIVVACINVKPTPSAAGSVEAKAKVEVKEFSDLDALLLCQFALKRASKDPEKAEVPYVTVNMYKGHAQYSWGGDTKMVRMRNGLGLEVASTAFCSVDLGRKKISSLVLDGQKLL